MYVIYIKPATMDYNIKNMSNNNDDAKLRYAIIRTIRMCFEWSADAVEWRHIRHTVAAAPRAACRRSETRQLSDSFRMNQVASGDLLFTISLLHTNIKDIQF